ncbi:MAG: AmmeMemoRadiSam system radical SAM enzyme [Nitrospirota bacterium]|nr:MAG: AmmeMemoRadiSam system radical SAM enzyme [Nitrospirota bacterium]
MKEAFFYEKKDDNDVKCGLCAHRCTIKNGKRGRCFVRENRDGTLYSLVYGKIVSINVDPIEKKPLFHFIPGSSSLSIATVGCNLSCLHCQNNEISQFPKEHKGTIIGTDMTPEAVVDVAVRNGCGSISYTYTEPTIFMEFAYDCARLAKKRGIKNVFVSNGYMTPESASFMAPYLDGNNIDLKGDEDFYKDVCGAHLEPVKETIKIMKDQGVWLEITTLIIPDHNDSDQVLTNIARFIASVSPDIPWHVTQYYPTYKLTDKPRTPIETLRRAREIGLTNGLRYVFEGNVPGEGRENTFCPTCTTLGIKRSGFSVIENTLINGRCSKCNQPIAGVWS